MLFRDPYRWAASDLGHVALAVGIGLSITGCSAHGYRIGDSAFSARHVPAVSRTDADIPPSAPQGPAIVQVQAAQPLSDTARADASSDGSAMTLEELEALAIANNPTLSELAATVRKGAGYRRQVATRPNPTVGYQGQQLADEGTDQHLAFVERQFVTGGKLALNYRVLDAAVEAQQQELEAQRLRVATDIRTRFYQALALQRKLELIGEFAGVSEEGTRIAEMRQRGEEGTGIDVLQAKIHASEIKLSHQQAEARWRAAWRELAAVAGVPSLEPRRLVGQLPDEAEPIDWQALAESMVASSPEYSAAQARIAQAQAHLERQWAQRVPNLSLQVAAGYDNGTDSGMMNVQVGAPLQINNSNQGNIAAARAEVCRAYMEAARIENSIKARVAVASQQYDSAQATVAQYSGEILPSAADSLELAEAAYRAGEADFVQILLARRTYFDANLQYLDAQTELAVVQAQIAGHMLSGSLDAVRDDSGDDSLRGLTLSQE
jgi:cobalt-zinc-cadmium efflux system outer membrane protein